MSQKSKQRKSFPLIIGILILSFHYSFAGVFTENFSADPPTTSSWSTTSFQKTIDGVSFTFTPSGTAEDLQVSRDDSFGSGNSPSLILKSISQATGTTETLTITRTDGNDFIFSSIWIGNANSQSSSVVTVQGYNNGSAVGSSQSWNYDDYTSKSFSDIVVDEIRIVSADYYYVNIDDFSGNTVVASNTTPTASSFTVTPTRYVPHIFSTANFGYSDGDSDPIDHVRVTAIPGNGVLYVDANGNDLYDGGEALSNNNTVIKANLDAGNLQYYNTDGTSSTFTFDVNDGTDFSASTYTATLTVGAASNPTITSSTYNATTGVLVVTGTNIYTNSSGADIDASTLTFTGEGGSGAAYTLTNTSDVERDSQTQFTVTLSSTDKAAVGQILNQNGTASSGGTTYILAAAEDWVTVVDPAENIADATNSIDVSNVPPYSGGDGSSEVTAYQIATLDDLQYLSEHSADWDKYFKQTADIDASATSTWNDNGSGGYYGFSPIGNNSTKFKGNYNGQNYTISNITINRSGQDYVGFFGCLFIGANISNLKLTDVSISGKGWVGGLAGASSDGMMVKGIKTISGCEVIGGTVTGNGSYIGGLIGYASTTNITNSRATATVNGTVYAGGFAGEIWSTSTNPSSISGCYATGNVTTGADGYSGGFIGSVSVYTTITNCYSSGNSTTSGDYSGGFIGRSDGTISNCYSTGSATGTNYVGAFIGSVTSGTVTNCFWDTQTSGSETGIGGGTTTGATGKTTEEMKTLATFTDATWDFSTPIWKIDAAKNNGYSYLAWQTFLFPTLTTTEATSISATSASLGGNITDNGGASVTERGVVYSVTSTNSNPEIGGTGVTTDTNGTGTGSFSENISGLSPGTEYSVQAYATNSVGTSYGGVESFTTLPPPPTITFATYDASTGVLVVTGTNFVSKTGASNDVDISTLTLTGEGGGTYTITSAIDVEITSATSFGVTLNSTDKLGVNSLLNKNGTSSDGGTTYNLAAADNWMAGAAASVDISDATENLITVSNVQSPAITDATYDASTGVLVVTGTNYVSKSGATNDVDISTLTLTGEGAGTYTITSDTDVEITSATSFSITLNSTDKLGVNSLLNKNGTSSDGGTTYNLAAADNWMAGAAASVDIADATGNGITVSNVSSPTITSSTYDASTGVLVVTGTNYVSKSGATNDVDISTLTLTGEGAGTYTITSDTDVEITSATSFSVTLNSTDKLGVNSLLNKNGTSSDGGTTYNLAAADNWMAGAAASVDIADATGNGITVSNVSSPTITSSTYDASTGVLVVTGTNYVSKSGATNDVDISTLTLTGEGAGTYTITSDTDVEITSATSFSVTLNSTDKLGVNSLLNKNGTSSDGGTTYNLAAADNWMAGAAASVDIADATGNEITVSNVSSPTITSSTYDASTGVLVVTGTNYVSKSGATNDVDISTLTLTGEGAGTYTITSDTDVEITSATSFSVTLNSTDKLGVNSLLNKNGTSSDGGTTYNLAAADNWMAGAAASVDIADATGNGITVSNVSSPTITSSTYDASTGVLVVTGTNYVSKSGATNDVDVSKLTLAGEASGTFTLTSSNVEISSATSFSVALNASDKLNVDGLLNKNGTSSDGGTTYNLAAADNWMAGAAASVNIADLTGNGITVSGISTATITTTVATFGVTSATMGGNITSNGGASVTERGVVYSETATNSNPEIGGTGVTTDTNGTGTGSFSESISGLTPGTEYSVQAYATNSSGTSYGGVETFTTINCDNPTSGGTIAAAQTICYGATPNALTSSALPTGHSGTLVYKWQSSIASESAGFSDIASSNGATFAPGALTNTTWFKRLARVECETDWTGAAESNVIKVTLRDDFTAGAIEITGDHIVFGGDPSIIGSITAAAGGDDNFEYRWQSSADENFTSPVNITGSNSADYDPLSGLTETTWYRRQAKDGACVTSFTSSTGVWQVTVASARVTNSTQNTQFSTIQQAIDNANPGDHIIVTEPTGEHLYIDKELTIEYDYTGQ